MKVFIFFPRFFKEILRLQNHTAQFCYFFPSAMIMNISNSRFSPQSAKKISKHTSAKRRSRRATWSSTVNCWTGCTSAYLRILCLSVAPWRTVVTSCFGSQTIFWRLPQPQIAWCPAPFFLHICPASSSFRMLHCFFQLNLYLLRSFFWLGSLLNS